MLYNLAKSFRNLPKSLLKAVTAYAFDIHCPEFLMRHINFPFR